eukprot:8477011-Pyramimonas_sp.AAC.1
MLSGLCRGSKGSCSFSGKQHVIREGLASPGVKWTVVVATYPKIFAELMVQTLLAPSRLACASQLEKSRFECPPTATLSRNDGRYAVAEVFTASQICLRLRVKVESGLSFCRYRKTRRIVCACIDGRERLLPLSLQFLSVPPCFVLPPAYSFESSPIRPTHLMHPWGCQ